jgi:DNA-binding beta-propeller fold protein YncE
VGEAALYVADEDHRAVRRVPVPVGDAASVRTVELSGAPAQVLPLEGKVLVTLRDPGALAVLEVDGSGALTERAKVALPADAWGLAVNAEESVALVTSAWTSKVSAVDLATLEVLWTIDVAREPRGVVLSADGATAWVTHLTGASLTRLESGPGWRKPPTARPVLLPPAPLRAPSGVTLAASLGYAAVLSPDGARLLVARHALGALGEDAWFGASTVDVLVTARDEPLAPRRHDRMPFLRADKAPTGSELIVPPKPLSAFTQPRDLAYRASARSLLVASEGDDVLVELDATAVDPTRNVLRRYEVGADRDPNLPVARTCGAPSGVALAEDEGTAYVWCRSTYDVATVPLVGVTPEGAPPPEAVAGEPKYLRLAEDPLEDADAALGRRLFFNATDRVTSGGLGCAGCHPEGRDDGHVWHEARVNTKDGTHTIFVGHEANIPAEEGVKGVPRRTPILAGVVAANGPYGWHGESPDLPARLTAGFGLHRWGGLPPHDGSALIARAGRLTVFLRKGLVPPPALGRELDETERRGRELFLSTEVGCAQCHVPATSYTNRASYALTKLPVRSGFDEEEEVRFKTPTLRHLAGRAPYFHDGRAPTLQWILDNNTENRMGTTSHLSGVDRAALVAFLRTL